MKRKLALLMSVVVLVLQLLACGEGQASAAENSKNETQPLIIAHGGYPPTLDIQSQSDVISSRPANMVFETLVENNPDGSFRNLLAESYEFLDDTHIKFNLRKGVTFHNGDPMTAEDVQWSLRRAVASAHVKSKAAFIDPEGFEIIDDHTIVVGFVAPNASALYMFAAEGLSILPSKLYADADSATISAHPIGTGAYKYVGCVNGESVTFDRYDGYWGEKAKIKTVVWRTITENANRTIELETGGAHFSIDILNTDVNRIQESEDVELLAGPNFSIQYVCYNTQQDGPLSDPKVRHALGMAVNKEAIVLGVYNGMGKAGVGPMVSNTLYATEDLPVDPFDLEAAKAALTAAGYPDGFNVRLYTNDNQARIDAAQIVKNAWAKIGVEAEITTYEFATYYQIVNSGDFDVCMLGWLSNGDPDMTTYGIYHSSMIGASNYTRTNRPEVDKLLTDGRRELDPEKRAEIYRQLQLFLVEYSPATYYWQGEGAHAYSAQLEPIPYTPYNFFPWEWSFKPE